MDAKTVAIDDYTPTSFKDYTPTSFKDYVAALRSPAHGSGSDRA